MSPTLGFISVIASVAIMLMGCPIGFGLLGIGSVMLIIMTNPATALAQVGLTITSSIANNSLIIIPLFVLMSNILVHSGLGSDGFNTIAKWTGHRKGGLAHSTIITCAIYGAATGNSQAATASMARIALPAMRKVGYKDVLSIGCIASSGTFATMIPPSMGLVLFAVALDGPVAPMLLAGYIPGVVTACLYMATVWIWVKLKPDVAPVTPKASLRERIASLTEIWPLLVLVAAILFFLYSGIITPTEVGAVGAASAFVLALIKRRLSLKQIWLCFADTARLSGSLFSTLIGAMVYSVAFTMSGVPRVISEFAVSLPVGPIWLVLLAIVVLFILGCFMSPTAIVFICAPLFYPIFTAAGIPYILYGIMFIKMIEIAAVTPPFGINLFAMKANVPDIKMGELIRGCIPFVCADLVVLAMLFFFPQIALFLPSNLM